MKMTLNRRILEIISCLLMVSTFRVEAFPANTHITWSDDAEIKWRDDIVLPDNPDVYKTSKIGGDTISTLLAGRTEFPFVVDIRVDGTDQELWAIGNLLSHTAVLTTCVWSWDYLDKLRAIEINATQEQDSSLHPETFDVYEPEVTILYAPLRLERELVDHEQHLWNSQTSKAKHGRRTVKYISTHPQCEQDPWNYDFSVLVLSREIPPLIPYVGYMPVRIERTHLQITDFDLGTHEGQNIVCHIASFGRNYVNWENHVGIDYKVKYRVYYEHYVFCLNQYKKYSYIKGPGKNLTAEEFEEIMENYFLNAICFNSRAKVGSVCDHDSGAPLVCDGKVFGIVSRGATYQFCNDIIQVPFIVTKITPASDYFMNLARNPFTFSLLVKEGDLIHKSSANLIALSELSFLFSVTPFFYSVFSTTLPNF